MNDLKLIDYLLGNLDPSVDEELAALLEKENTDARLDELGRTLHVLADGVSPVSPSKPLKSHILATATRSPQGRLTGFARRLADFFQFGLEQAQAILNTVGDLQHASWSSNPRPGVWLQHFDGGESLAGADCGLIHLDPGVDVDRHEHLGDEWMFIVDGFVTTDTGEELSPGDLLHSETGSAHSFTVDKDTGCVFAVIVTNGIRWVN